MNKTIKVQLVLSEEINNLLKKLAKEECRTRSAVAERAILAYWSKKQEDLKFKAHN
jgi:predicted transcriptional regulator